MSTLSERPWDDTTVGAYEKKTTPEQKRHAAVLAAQFYGDDRDGLRAALAAMGLDRLPVGGAA